MQNMIFRSKKDAYNIYATVYIFWLFELLWKFDCIHGILEKL
jgi:hypothetical protein